MFELFMFVILCIWAISFLVCTITMCISVITNFSSKVMDYTILISMIANILSGFSLVVIMLITVAIKWFF